jgi:serine/threonine-protein kinase
VVTSRIDDLVGRVLGERYRLTRPLGVGASAHVYVAEDTKLRRKVAVKLLHPALAGEAAFLARFDAEARTVASLRHPNILRLYDSGRDEAGPYLVMELLEGGSLRAILDQGSRLSPGQAAAVGSDVARGLAHAHRQGLVHRDIKPANLIFDDEGRVYIADFGLARALAEAALTEPKGAVVGTGRYAAPETLSAGHLDAKADVYSLAVVLAEALSGEVPLVADTPLGTLALRAGTDMPVPEAAGPLGSILQAAGRRDPAERPDAAGLAEALSEVAARLPRPAPLALRPPADFDAASAELVDPTELGGRPRLFDGAAPSDGGDDDANGDGGVSGEAAGGGAASGGSRRSARRMWALAAAVIVLVGGGAVAWAVATGRLVPASHPVPSLVGKPRQQAAAALSRLHVRLGVSSSVYSSRYPAGDVVSQSPAQGRIDEGKVISVVVSLGPAPVGVPALAGDTEQAAEQALSALGLRWTLAPEASSMTVPAGDVISSKPSSGTLIPGQSVSIVVSSGKPKVAVPSLAAGAAATAAQSALSAAGLTVAEVSDYSNTVARGDVISLSPASGSTVIVGSQVTVTVSLGPHYVTVPNLAGDSVGAAVQALATDGLGVAGTNGNPINSVTATSPVSGTQVLYGTSVTLVTG